jgi:hypothetical protein
MSSPFMGRVLPIHGEVAPQAPEGPTEELPGPKLYPSKARISSCELDIHAVDLR